MSRYVPYWHLRCVRKIKMAPFLLFIGDGGAPLVCPIGRPEDNRYAQNGIVSWGILFAIEEKNIPINVIIIEANLSNYLNFKAWAVKKQYQRCMQMLQKPEIGLMGKLALLD